jgi:DNA-binding SARP family transcriptional activator
MELRLLGTTELVIDSDGQALGGPMVRAVLADLALHAGQTVATSQLVDDLWGQSPPASAAHTAQAYISRHAAASRRRSVMAAAPAASAQAASITTPRMLGP